MPDDAAHVMYVWFDALSNYLSGLDYMDEASPLRDFWPCDVHVIGKDIVWFHAVIWPCMLFSCDIPLPRSIFAHGFVNDAEGQKMSKSIGNVVDPVATLREEGKGGADRLRWYLLRDAHFGADVPFSREGMRLICDADLADKLGNVLNRACNLCFKYCGGVVPAVDGDLVFSLADAIRTIEDAADAFDLRRIAEVAIESVRSVNAYLQESKPWDKSRSAEFRSICVRRSLESLYAAAHLLSPVVPGCAAKILRAVGSGGGGVATFRELRTSGNLRVGAKVAKSIILFPKRVVVGKKKKNGAATTGGKLSLKALGKLPAIAKLEFRVGKIVRAEPLKGSEKCYVEAIDLGESGGPRTVVSGLRAFYATADELVGTRVVVAANLKPRKIAGELSHGMVLCGWSASRDACELLMPPAEAALGERVRIPGHVGDDAPDVGPLGAGASTKAWKKVAGDLRTNEEGVAQYKGVPLTLKGGVCRTSAKVSGGRVE